MASEQQPGTQEQQSRHDGGASSEAPESGALGTRQNESSQPIRSAASTPDAGRGSSQSSSGEQRGQGMQSPGGSAGQGMARGGAQAGLNRAGRLGQSGPLSLMRRINQDLDRLFEGFFGPSLLGSSSSLLGGSPFGLGPSAEWPELEVHQDGDRLVIQADLPGLSREDVHVEVHEQHLTISGERRTQNERQQGGIYHSERSYGSFSRTLSLPENAKLDSASASFENGVLRIEIEAPMQGQSRGRRIEIREGKPQ